MGATQITQDVGIIAIELDRAFHMALDFANRRFV